MTLVLLFFVLLPRVACWSGTWVSEQSRMKRKQVNRIPTWPASMDSILALASTASIGFSGASRSLNIHGPGKSMLRWVVMVVGRDHLAVCSELLVPCTYELEIGRIWSQTREVYSIKLQGKLVDGPVGRFKTENLRVSRQPWQLASTCGVCWGCFRLYQWRVYLLFDGDKALHAMSIKGLVMVTYVVSRRLKSSVEKGKYPELETQTCHAS